jgi:hypothetical protein
MDVPKKRSTATFSDRDIIQWWLVIAAVVVTITVVIVAQIEQSRSTMLVANLVTLLLTFYVSYAITEHFAKQTARGELGDLAEAAGSRIFLLSSQLGDLADEVTSFESDDERASLFLEMTASQMNKLASQVELSFQDLQRIAKLDISIPAIRDEVRSRIEEASRKEAVSCPHCEEPKEVLFSISAGSTKATRCDKCRQPFRVHRIADGSLKISYDQHFEIDCPNEKCANRIMIKRTEREWGAIIRNCFQCYARIRYDLDKGKVEEFRIEEPLGLSRNSIQDGRGPCPDCGYQVIFKGARNAHGDELQSCPRCTQLIRISDTPAGY